MRKPYAGRNDHLKRLPKEFYLGNSYVHWTMTIQDRRIGWLSEPSHYQFREMLTHTTFRYGLAIPLYCCMPDHMHFLMIGLYPTTDQLAAVKYFRNRMGLVLEKRGFEFQHQAYDHVLQDNEREQTAFENTGEYIARNPERAGLVPEDGFREYPFTDCLLPGYPELHFQQTDFWERFWRTIAYIQKSREAN